MSCEAAWAQLEEAADFLIMEFPFPELNTRAGRHFLREPEGAFAAAVRKSPEISLRKMTPEMRERFRTAKLQEIKGWLQHKCVEAAQRVHGQIPMKMRWCLTVKDDGRAKARLVVLGFQDHRLGQLDTESPTVSARGRALALQICANQGLRLHKGT